MSSNPFSSRERQHFPEFSPMFYRKKTPTSTERQPGFRWSIDQIARLKPADIDTDPATLVKTNGHSPDNNADTQKDVDKFFSQKSILPSPWPTAACTSRLPLPAKRVTFSPHPPSTAFIREDASLFESEMRDSRTADAGTQTALTFPMNFDLEHLIGQCLLGQVMNHMDEDGTRDLGNSSLRRKLFGKPDRQGSPDSSDSGEGDTVPSVPMMTHPLVEVSHDGLVVPPTFTPISKKSSSKASFPSGTSTPLHSSHSPALPSHYLKSPAIVFTKPSASKYDQNHRESLKEENPAHSSMVLQTPGKCVPFFSPIGSDEDTKNLCTGLAHKDSVDGVSKNGHVCVNNLFPVTPNRDTVPPPEDQLNSPPPLSPIVSTPAPSAAASPMVVGEGSKVRSSKLSSNQAKCTSTPNTGVMKRQLAASPFASPVLKHPCTTRPDMEEEEEEGNPTNNNVDPHFNRQPSSHISLKHQQQEQQRDNGNLSEEMAQPLSLADLHTDTYTYDLTNVTSTACYTAMDLGEPDFDDNTASDSRQHPLHSTAAFMAPSIWHPPIQSILADSQSHTRLNSLTQQQQYSVISDASQTKMNMLSQQNQGSGVHIPYGRNWSHIQAPVSTSIGQSGIDSGVAVAFSETHGASGMYSKFASGVVDSESGLSASSSKCDLPSLQPGKGDGGADSNDRKALTEDDMDIRNTRTNDESYSCVHLSPFRNNPTLMRVDSKHQMLSTIKEGDENRVGPFSSGVTFGVAGAETNVRSEKRRLHAQLERDSGLFSPEVRDCERLTDANFHKAPGTTQLNGIHTISSQILTPPSRHCNLPSTVPTTSKSANVEPHHNIYMYTNPQHFTYAHSTATASGTVAASSNTGSKFTAKRGITPTSVLPSRLKLASGTLHLSSDSPTRSQTYSPMSTNVTPHTTNVSGGASCGRGLGAFGSTRTSSGSEVWQSSPSFHRTPPSRYSSSLGSLKLMSSESNSCGSSRKTGLTGFPGDVLRKKETLKARLQFSNTVSNPLKSSCNSQYDSNVVIARRIPLGETSLNRPKASLASMTRNHYNEGCSPLSPSPINLTRSPWQLPLAFSPLHRPATITSSSHASHVTRWKNRT